MAEILYESNYYGVSSLGDSLEHHGIKGQKWGIRRFQNPDGSLTSAGKQRYSVKMARKYHLFEEHPKKEQAWDNARYIKDAGGRHSEIKKYLRENKLPIKEWEEQNGYGKRFRDDVKEAVSNAKAKREEKKAERAAAERQNAFETGDLVWAKKNASKLSNAELNDIINRANTMKKLDDLANPDRKSSMERIQNAADKLSSFGNSIANAKNAYDRVKDAFKPKEKKEEKSALEELYDKNFEDATKAAVNKARKDTSGSLADKEFAAYMTLKSMENSRTEAKKKAAEIDKAIGKQLAERTHKEREAGVRAAVREEAIRNREERAAEAEANRKIKEQRQDELERIRKLAGGRMWL